MFPLDEGGVIETFADLLTRPVFSTARVRKCNHSLLAGRVSHQFLFCCKTLIHATRTFLLRNVEKIFQPLPIELLSTLHVTPFPFNINY